MEQYSCDVLCLGGGGAGVTAAVKAAQCGADVILVSKEPLGYGDTRISMGFIVNPGMTDGDSEEKFFEDLIAGGEYINDRALARIMAERARRGPQILEEFGHLFQRDEEGKISAAVASATGGHSVKRTLGCPPSAGIGMGGALRAAAARSGVRVFEETAAYSLVADGGRVAGAVCFDLVRGEVILFGARTVVIATGGAAWLYYPHCDCSAGATGDGYALAFALGAELTDMEQVQFIPFGLSHPSSLCGLFLGEPNLLLPEGVIRNNKGEIVLEDAGRMTRAAVVAAMARELARGGATEYGGLWLDLRPNLASAKGRRMWERRCADGQLDVIRFAYGEKAYRWEEPWDVAPTAHYIMGGIRVDGSARSTVPGLYAAGQAMGGIHGANRLGSVSLGEIFVFGEIAGEAAAREAGRTRAPRLAGAGRAVDELRALPGRRGRVSPLVLQRRLQRVMWEKAGLVREEKGLNEALAGVAAVEEAAADLSIPSPGPFNLQVLHAMELKHMLVCAKMVICSALERRETRGAHLRLDYPARDDAKWLGNTVVTRADDRVQVRMEAIGL